MLKTGLLLMLPLFAAATPIVAPTENNPAYAMRVAAVTALVVPAKAGT